MPAIGRLDLVEVWEKMRACCGAMRENRTLPALTQRAGENTSPFDLDGNRPEIHRDVFFPGI